MGRAGGLKLYILNKMKDTNFNGKKNNMYSQTILNKKRFKINIKLSFSAKAQLSIKDSLILPSLAPPCLSRGGVTLSLLAGRGTEHRLNFFQNQRKYYHISNIRAVNRIGPHNEDIFYYHRSEEHTSELQSLRHLVCSLLL